MKKLVTIILGIAALPVFSQSHLLGLKGGVSSTNITGHEFLLGDEPRSGVTVGLTYEREFEKMFRTGIDLVYTQKGFRDELVYTNNFGDPTGESGIMEFDYDYLSMPLKGGVAIGKNVSGFVNLGIVPSFLVHAETRTPQFGDFGPTTYDMTKSVRRVDLGGLAEVGGNIRIKERFVISASLAYQQDFISITNKDYFDGSKARHNGLTASLALKYALKKG